MIGQRLSHYTILEKIGEGGMGVVYKAEDTRLKRTVALKFLAAAALSGETERARFYREAQAAAALNHPNICTIYEIDEADGQVFIAMEWISGQSLRDRISQRPLKLEEALDNAVQAGLGLKAAHDAGMVHRDVKSANIMLNDGGQVKIMDFGLALRGGASRITKTGITVGTVAYMSPEQALGQPVDRRTDIWSLGVVLYEMVAGRLPFASENEQAVLYALINEDPEPPTALRTGVPVGLDRVVGKAMAKSPEERYQHVDELLVDLREVKRQLETGERERVKPSIAVLPLTNMNRDEESDLLCDGIADDIASALTKLAGLRVAAANAAYQFKGKVPDLREVGRKLKVNCVLTGSLRRAGDRLRITVRLSNVGDGYEMWSERYDRVLEDVFAIQDEISQAVVDTLKVKLVGDEPKQLAKRYTENIKAYNLYLKGRLYWNKRTPESIHRARELFESALTEDPDYALAQSGLADCTTALAFYGLLPPLEVLPRAKAAALKALEIDPSLAEAHASLGIVVVVQGRDWELAERELQRAVALDPTYAAAHFWRAVFTLPALGRLNEALASARRAQEADPVTPMTNVGAGAALFFQRDYRAAIEEFITVLELDPNYHWMHFFLGRALLFEGRHQEAIEALKKANLLMFREGQLGYAYAMTGNRGEAYKILEGLKDPARPRYITAYQSALVYTGLGEADRAFESLETAEAEHSANLVWLNPSPEFDPLRADLRWKELLRKLNLPVE